jgi:hypothetical protein
MSQILILTPLVERDLPKSYFKRCNITASFVSEKSDERTTTVIRDCLPFRLLKHSTLVLKIICIWKPNAQPYSCELQKHPSLGN